MGGRKHMRRKSDVSSHCAPHALFRFPVLAFGVSPIPTLPAQSGGIIPVAIVIFPEIANVLI